MLRNLITSPGEAASGVGLIGLGAVTPLMIEPHLGSLVTNIEPRWHWLFSWVGGYCAAVGLGQLGAMLLDWKRARLWVARGAVTAAALILVAYVPVKFFGVSVLGVTLAIINTLSAVRWELRASEPSA